MFMNNITKGDDPGYKCDICGGEIEPELLADGTTIYKQGFSADPIEPDGHACRKCDNNIVIPARTRLALRDLIS